MPETAAAHRSSKAAPAVLDIKGLTTSFATPSGVAHAVDTVNLVLEQGETLAVVGESGCGKTVLALSVMGLIPDPPGRITAGEVFFQDRDLLGLSEAELREVRGNHIAMIFQEPMTALNPVFTVGEQIAEPLRLHKGVTGQEAEERVHELLHMVGIPEPAHRARNYPHELSGGMRQRVMIAMALSCDPSILIADEPTTALDVTIQAQILDLLIEVREDTGSSGILITHDLGVVTKLCSRVAVMYAGQVVEEATVRELYKDPQHPYSQGLLASLPRMARGGRLSPIPGTVPSIFDFPNGCRFHPRCPRAMDICAIEPPPHFDLGSGRFARCWLHGK